MSASFTVRPVSMIGQSDWRYLSSFPTAAEYERGVMIETRQYLLGMYYVQHVCVLSQGVVLSDGRKRETECMVAPCCEPKGG